jgi:hypothetical protein
MCHTSAMNCNRCSFKKKKIVISVRVETITLCIFFINTELKLILFLCITLVLNINIFFICTMTYNLYKEIIYTFFGIGF